MKNTFLFLLFLSLIIACNQQTDTKQQRKDIVDSEIDQSQPQVIDIQTVELKKLMKQNRDLQIVDVRTPQEVEKGYINGAITGMNVLDGEFEKRMDTLDKNSPVVIYCASGKRSTRAAELLKSSGFTSKIYNYTGGYSAWSSESQ
ncbi:MAG: rhodanese-like domain-containing protein [Fulvivirga sp.]|nr:rhodanese-like domain-containing protein [Fulvivirga sp.]